MARSNSELVNSSETDLAEEPNHDVIVVGAGLSGLACALTLHRAGVNVAVVEASDGVGGRVRTDIVDGFQLDRGFQIFLTAYPEARSMLDYDRLNLRPFYAGAMVRFGGSWHKVADPFRHPWDGVLSLLNPVGTVGDKIKVGVLRLGLMARDPDDLLEAAETSTLERLKAEGFSDSMIKRFFRPFLGGIFFDNNLRTTSRLFEFVMRMLSTGANTLPANGIGAIAQNLTDQLPPGCVKTGVEVTRCAGASNGTLPSIQVATGESLTAGSGIVIAAEEPSARKILGSILEAMPSKPGPGVGTCCLYFRADSAPSSAENILYLNGEGEGLVNNCCFPSTVAKEYAPPGETLVSVSVIGTHEELNDQQLEDRVLEELSSWFGSACVSMWRHIKTYRIPFCQPNQTPPTDLKRPVKLGNGLYVSGDHRDSATFDGALKSGRRAAEAVLESM